MSKPRTVLLASLSTLKANPRNTRTHSKKQTRRIAESIRRFGWTCPILIDENHFILAGHGRYEAARQLGLSEVPTIVVSGLSDPEKRALALADNKVPSNAGWDRKLLAAELGELARLLPEYNLGLEITGFEPSEIDSLFGDFSDPEIDPADEMLSLDQQKVSAFGDLWEMGEHRLLCGNSLRASNIHKLMGDELARLVIADAPYNLKINDVQGLGHIKHREFAQASGEMSSVQFTRFLRTAMVLARKHSVEGSIAFWFGDWRHIREMLAAGDKAYTELKNLMVWAKTNAGMGTFYRSQHELVFAFKNGDAPHTNNFRLGEQGRNRSNLWTYAGNNSFRAGQLDDLSVHPTPKPVALIADATGDRNPAAVCNIGNLDRNT